MTNANYSSELIRMRETDLRVRQQLAETGELYQGYNPTMEQVHLNHARRLEEIIGLIGWPTADKVGEEANRAAFLIAQHAISLPEFQRKCLELIAAEIKEGRQEKSAYAYLYDRICCHERRPQRFGTQYDWDENGEMSPCAIEDPDNVNRLRAEYGLNPLEEEAARMRQGIRESGEKPPADFRARQEEMLAWSRRVGWIR